MPATYNPTTTSAMTEPDSLFEKLGGESGVRKLVDHFYDQMDALDEAREVRDLHPADLTDSRQKFFEFLCGWTGGPQLYVAKHGHPRLRARHMPFAIGDREAAQWMRCMVLALDETVDDQATRTFLADSFLRVAAHMRNQ